MTPVKAVPGLYSFSAMIYLLKEWLVYVVAFDDQFLLLNHFTISSVIGKTLAKILSFRTGRPVTATSHYASGRPPPKIRP
jgi:hypothetical protein